ncbi:hypothetical protein PybrP1_012621 [[Pythium] brassicae (nom. inval.)]|nr:hypothetical protein PybrP1_012621 [[Pythium] brassicae (nom. inval.)]
MAAVYAIEHARTIATDRGSAARRGSTGGSPAPAGEDGGEPTAPDPDSTTPAYHGLAEVYVAVSSALTADDEDATVFYHDGTNQIVLDELHDQLAILPEMELEAPADLATADAGEPDGNTPEELERLKRILARHHMMIFWSGNALPRAARGVVCDLEPEPGTKSPAQRARRIPGHLLPKVYELLNRLLESGIIEMSWSEWASPIVIVTKKNSVDIRLCIDYRLQLRSGHVVLEPGHGIRHLGSVDNRARQADQRVHLPAQPFSVGQDAFRLEERAARLSAHHRQLRLGARLPAPWLEKDVDTEVLEFFGVDPARYGLGQSAEWQKRVRAAAQCEGSVSDNCLDPEFTCPPSASGLTVFELDIPAHPTMDPVLRRGSYIDDIAYGARDCDDLCVMLENLLYRPRYWGISISLPKSSFGKRTIPYLSHKVTRHGIRVMPKLLKERDSLLFPCSLKVVQSYLGSLNY